MGCNAELVRCSLAIKGELSSSRRMSKRGASVRRPCTRCPRFLAPPPFQRRDELCFRKRGCGGQRQQRGDSIEIFHYRALAREAVPTAPQARPCCRGGIPTIPSRGDLQAGATVELALLTQTELRPERTQSLLQPSQPLRSPKASS